MLINLENLENETKLVREKIKTHIQRDFLLLIYNDTSEEGIIESDAILLKSFLECCSVRNLSIILHGDGGDFRTSILMAHLLNEGLSSFNTYVPLKCCSALCCLFLKSHEMTSFPDAKITQIDPVYQHNGAWFRAIKHLKSEDQFLKESANKVFHFATFNITQLLTKRPSLFKFKDVDYDDFGHTNEIVSIFMNKEEHASIILPSELQRLDLNIIESKDTTLFEFMRNLITKCQIFLNTENKRLILLSSADIEKGGEIYHFIVPDL